MDRVCHPGFAPLPEITRNVFLELVPPAVFTVTDTELVVHDGTLTRIRLLDQPA